MIHLQNSANFACPGRLQILPAGSWFSQNFLPPSTSTDSTFEHTSAHTKPSCNLVTYLNSTQHTQTLNPTTSINMSTDVDSTATFMLHGLTVPKSSMMMVPDQGATNGSDVKVSLTTYISSLHCLSFPLPCWDLSRWSASRQSIFPISFHLLHLHLLSPSGTIFTLTWVIASLYFNFISQPSCTPIYGLWQW